MSIFRRKILNNIEDINSKLLIDCPLVYNDFEDHVSHAGIGAPYNNNRSDNLQWNSNIGAYLFHSETIGENGLRIPLSGLKDRFGEEQDFTISYKIRGYNNKMCTYASMIGYCTSDYAYYETGYPTGHLVGRQYFNNDEFGQYVMVTDYANNTYSFYYNGVFKTTVQTGITPLGLKPNWKDAYYNYITIAPAVGGNFVTHAYIKDFKMYKGQLSIEEIKLIG